mmetsp:Transcript_48336/g.149307  ORF Transcript_48336/g.149307 Transcript_48336/m.149307 type:complete len:220 (-) Transcript_48336:251-910(-)
MVCDLRRLLRTVVGGTAGREPGDRLPRGRRDAGRRGEPLAQGERLALLHAPHVEEPGRAVDEDKDHEEHAGQRGVPWESIRAGVAVLGVQQDLGVTVPAGVEGGEEDKKVEANTDVVHEDVLEGLGHVLLRGTDRPGFGVGLLRAEGHGPIRVIPLLCLLDEPPPDLHLQVRRKDDVQGGEAQLHREPLAHTHAEKGLLEHALFEEVLVVDRPAAAGHL